MPWKRAFVALLSLDLLVVAALAALFASFPSIKSSPAPPTAVAGQAATVQIAIGDQAINTYLDYALSEQKDVSRVLEYARVQFNADWHLDLGVKMSNRVVPLSFVLTPDVRQGDLLLHVNSATMGEIPVPTGLLFLLLKHLPWPAWIDVDANQATLVLAFSRRPANPYGIHADGYSAATRLLTLSVSIVPKSLHPPASG
jgi:uncharacterized protein YpmS